MGQGRRNRHNLDDYHSRRGSFIRWILFSDKIGAVTREKKMSDKNDSILKHVLDQIFPSTPDFYRLLAEQCLMVSQSVDNLVKYLEDGDPVAGARVKKDEHEADSVKIRNLHLLNETFSTPIDREDIYRAVTGLDEIINYCKSTVSEMDVLGVKPDAFMQKMASSIQDGVEMLTQGFAKLATDPVKAAEHADAARKGERHVEKTYRKALANLFQGDDYINMFKRREIYRHLSNAADRMAHCANTLHDIVVKIS